MHYSAGRPVKELGEELDLYAQRAYEYGASGVESVLDEARAALEAARRAIEALPPDPVLAAREPDDLEAIRALRPEGPRRVTVGLPDDYEDRLAGAYLGRAAGCVLGAIVEFWSVEKMEQFARENRQAFPPTDYWESAQDPYRIQYLGIPRYQFTRPYLHGIPTDDDLTYTILGLLIAERYGPDFSRANVGQAWVDLLPMACTAEEIALENLKAGVPAEEAGERGNPYTEWIGADIRSDPWGYLAPGWPERAAEMAWRDAWVSHRRHGIHGEMYFSAAIAAAFTVDDPVEALRIGLTEIPAECLLAQSVRWALDEAPGIRGYRDARAAVDERFRGMSGVHTVNNACLTVWGITIGGTDFTKVIGETVAMGLDNDCTAATAGSIVGAVIGRNRLPEHWYRPFGDLVHTYLIGHERLAVSDVLERFAAQARRVREG